MQFCQLGHLYFNIGYSWSQLPGRTECPSRVAILVDLLQYGQLFKVCANNYLAQIAQFLSQFL